MLTGQKIKSGYCHVATTISAPNKTLQDDEQGEAQATLDLSPNLAARPFYFDIFKKGWLKGKTNPLTKNLTATSLDGGAAYFNLPPSKELYVLSAKKNGMIFSSAKFLCREDVFINISPPRGPMAQY